MKTEKFIEDANNAVEIVRALKFFDLKNITKFKSSVHTIGIGIELCKNKKEKIVLLEKILKRFKHIRVIINREKEIFEKLCEKYGNISFVNENSVIYALKVDFYISTNPFFQTILSKLGIATLYSPGPLISNRQSIENALNKNIDAEFKLIQTEKEIKTPLDVMKLYYGEDALPEKEYLQYAYNSLLGDDFILYNLELFMNFPKFKERMANFWKNWATGKLPIKKNNTLMKIFNND